MQFYKSNGNLVVASHHIVMLIFLMAPTAWQMDTLAAGHRLVALATRSIDESETSLWPDTAWHPAARPACSIHTPPAHNLVSLGGYIQNLRWRVSRLYVGLAF